MLRNKSESKSNVFGFSLVLSSRELKTKLQRLLDIVNDIIDDLPNGRLLKLERRRFKQISKGREYEYEYVELFEGYGGNKRLLKRWNAKNVPPEVLQLIEIERFFCELKGELMKVRFLIEKLLEESEISGYVT